MKFCLVFIVKISAVSRFEKRDSEASKKDAELFHPRKKKFLRLVDDNLEKIAALVVVVAVVVVVDDGVVVVSALVVCCSCCCCC